MKATILDSGALRIEAADGAERFFLRYLAESPSGVIVSVDADDAPLEAIEIGRRPEKPKPPIRPAPNMPG